MEHFAHRAGAGSRGHGGGRDQAFAEAACAAAAAAPAGAGETCRVHVRGGRLDDRMAAAAVFAIRLPDARLEPLGVVKG